jgi:hypothetical protein
MRAKPITGEVVEHDMPRKGVEHRHIQKPSPRELGSYGGQWVAILHGHVVASGKSPLTVLAQGRKVAGKGEPMVFRVPHPGEIYLL